MGWPVSDVTLSEWGFAQRRFDYQAEHCCVEMYKPETSLSHSAAPLDLVRCWLCTHEPGCEHRRKKPSGYVSRTCLHAEERGLETRCGMRARTGQRNKL